MTEIENLKNIGAKTGGYLRDIGITSYEDLAALGTEEAFQRLYFRFQDEMKFTSVFLYAIEGALTGQHWNDIGSERKEALKVYFRQLSGK